MSRQGHGHGHAHHAADTALSTSRAGLRALWVSFAVLAATASVQGVVVVASGSAALLGDTLHNLADALTAVPLAIAFLLGRRAATRRYTYGFGRAEDLAGLVVVATIAVSAAAAGYVSVQRLIDRAEVQQVAAVGAAGLVGFLGNEWVARYRIAVGRRIGSAALVANGLHARTDGFASLAVVLSAAAVAAGFPLADPVIGLGIAVGICLVLRQAGREVFGRLMDAVDPGLTERAEAALTTVEGIGVGEVRLRWLGHSLRAEAEITVDGGLSVAQAHRIAVEAEHALVHAVPRLAAATVHADPDSAAGARTTAGRYITEPPHARVTRGNLGASCGDSFTGTAVPIDKDPLMTTPPELRRRARRREVAAAALAVAAVLATATPAAGHGIGADASDKSVLEFVPIGIEHMLLGWDHLLFVAGVVLLAGNVARAAKLISAFVVGHSLTLIVATLAGWRVNPTAIDAVIGLSVVFVGVVGLWGRPRRWGWFAAVVFGFGLLHGVGLSTRLQDLGLPEDGLLGRVIAFNVGVEIGQLGAVAVMVVVGRLVRALLRRPAVERAAFGALGLAGATAAAVFGGLAAIDIMEDGQTAVASQTSSCTVGDRTFGFTLGAGGHPPKPFYEPYEQIPSADFGHVIGDGFLVVTYPPSLSAADVDQLRSLTQTPRKTVGGPLPDQAEPVRALHAYAQLTCTKFDLDAVRQFTDSWFADPRSRTPESS